MIGDLLVTPNDSRDSLPMVARTCIEDQLANAS